MASPPKVDQAILHALRQGSAPAAVKRQAARGTLPVAADDLLEILVFLTADPDPTCRDEARKTLAGWPEGKCAALLSRTAVSSETLAYFASQPQLPVTLVHIIAAHPKANDKALAPLVGRLSGEQIKSIAGDIPRLAEMPRFAAGLLQRSDLPVDLRQQVEELHQQQGHEPEKLAAVLSREEEAATQAPPQEKRERMSLTQKVAQMTVAERVQLALKGSKDERMILIRDPSKVVYRAVLQSPKLSENEVESFASMKIIAEEALRIIAGSRKFRKNYAVVRNLVNNPRTPLDISLTLLNRLTDRDVRFLSKNRNIPDTLRNMALRVLQKRSGTRTGGGSFR